MGALKSYRVVNGPDLMSLTSSLTLGTIGDVNALNRYWVELTLVTDDKTSKGDVWKALVTGLIVKPMDGDVVRWEVDAILRRESRNPVSGVTRESLVVSIDYMPSTRKGIAQVGMRVRTAMSDVPQITFRGVSDEATHSQPPASSGVSSGRLSIKFRPVSKK